MQLTHWLVFPMGPLHPHPLNCFSLSLCTALYSKCSPPGSVYIFSLPLKIKLHTNSKIASHLGLIMSLFFLFKQKGALYTTKNLTQNIIKVSKETKRKTKQKNTIISSQMSCHSLTLYLFFLSSVNCTDLCLWNFSFCTLGLARPNISVSFQKFSLSLFSIISMAYPMCSPILHLYTAM